VMGECERVLDGLVDWSLRKVVCGPDEGLLGRVDVVQPVTFAVMVGLAAVWRWLGVVPDAVVGHSQGELAAACVAGVLSLPDALRVVVYRSGLVARELAGAGAMASVGVSEAGLRPLLARYPQVQVAAVNSPASLVVSGPAAAVQALVAAAQADGLQARLIPVDYASHSSGVQALQEQLGRFLAGIGSAAPQCAWYSTVDNQWIRDRLPADYWYRNLRQPVRFADAVTALAQQGYTVYIEASTHPVLTVPIQQTLDGTPHHVTATLHRGNDTLTHLLTNAATLHTHTTRPPDWQPLIQPHHPQPTTLPTYPFQHKNYWLDSQPSHNGDISAAELSVAELLRETNMTTDQPLPALLADAAGDERLPLIVDAVRREACAILGHSRLDEIQPDTALFEVGFSSLTAVELRNRLNVLTGLELPVMLLFDHPTPAMVAEFLDRKLG